MNARLGCYLLVFTFLNSTLSWAQNELSRDERERASKQVVLPAVVDPTLTSSFGSQLQFAFEGTKEDNTVKARLGFQYGDFLFDTVLQGPISTASTRGDLANLDGLVGTATVDIGVTWNLWHPTADATEQRSVCVDYMSTLSIEEQASFVCTFLTLPERGGYRDRFDAAVDYGTPILLGGRFRTGRQNFQYLEPGTLTEQEDAKTNRSVRGYAGGLFDFGYLGVNHRYEVSHKAGNETEVCTPLGTGGALSCSDVVLGAPTERRANITQIELRHFVGENIGLNPRFNYKYAQGAEESVASVEFLVYFLQDRSNGLNGGLNLGWRSDTDAFTITLFVGSAFGLLP